MKVFYFLSCWSPFVTDDTTLRSIFTGKITDDHVNADDTLSIGKTISEKLLEVSVFDYKFETKFKAENGEY